VVSRGAIVLVLAVAACAGPRELMSSYISDEPSMERIAVAAEACGFEKVRLERVGGMLTPANTRMRMRLPAERRNDPKPGKCLSEWLDAHPEIEYELYVRSAG
jgi:hypothetical protein